MSDASATSSVSAASYAADRLAPTLPPSVPRRHAPRLHALGRWLLRRTGWRIEGNFPDLPRVVVVVAPHTSNWDFLVGVMAMLALDLDPRWLGKHTLFRFPLGPVLRRLGGVPVRRGARLGAVDDTVAALRAADRMVLALAPEGTRRKTTGWKSGYHAIAAGAGVPVVPVWIDWARHVVGIGAPTAVDASAEQTTARLRALYDPSMARRPENF